MGLNTHNIFKKIYSINIYMENQNVKRGRGRPRILTDAERKNNKTTYMLYKPWYCDICNTGRNYTLAGQHCHLKTKNHIKNVNVNNIMKKINDITHKK